MSKPDLGTAVLRPRRAQTAGESCTLRWTYTAGHPVDDSGAVKIVFRQMGDFGVPQFDRPGEPNYCTVHTTGTCRVVPRWDRKGHVRPWGRTLRLRVTGGYLDRGERITVVFGDTSHGSPGWQLQTFCEDTFEFKTLVDPFATVQFKELPASPTLRIVPGTPVRAVCIAPSHAQAGKAFHVRLKLEDRWGNPTATTKELRQEGFDERGPRTVRVSDRRTGLSARSNPIDVLAARPPLRRCWADLHGQSEETVGTNSVEDYFTFARDFGCLDVAAHQGNDFQVTDAFWEAVNRTARAFHRAGRFVTFPGYEWSGNTPLGGDRNVLFESEGGPIVHSGTDLLPGEPSDYTVAPTAAELFEELGRCEDPRAFAFAHVGGRYADLSMHDPAVELAVEVHSAWGTFEWLVDEALRRGYRVGFCANSDGHKGRPGASYPGAATFGSLGGLTCVFAPRLDRAAVVAALRARHCYATTGHRPLLDVAVTAADGRRAMMGDVLDVGDGAPRLDVRVVGTGPVESVEVRSGTETVRTVRPYESADLGRRLKVIWSGAEVPGRARAVSWDGGLRVKGNRIVRAVPVNFWNPDRPLERRGKNELAWRSTTTGGLAGVVLTLNRPLAGTLEIETAQRNVRCAIRTVGRTPRTWDCGGLAKTLRIGRLPDRGPAREVSFSLPLTRLRRGDNPVYVRVEQVDGHRAWSSPVFLQKA
jgi:hypothetical protein